MSLHDFVVGVVADTHGYLDPEVLDCLSDVDVILHAGDIGPDRVLEALRAAAPVIAVTGNGDEALRHVYPWDQRVELGRVRLLLCHWYDNFGMLHPRIERELRAWEPHALVFGHTHSALCEWRSGVLHFNPGYAGPPGQGRPRSVGRLWVDGESVRAQILPLSSTGA
ncbi:MAG TPA: metallophosphoesterase family protein [Myxococcota bacterium]|nr:metallophosphoesterase family protein [Myxococcota bacterium]